MGNMFDMGAVATARVVENNRLKCGIHDVIFKGIERGEDFGPNAVGTIDIHFEAVDGSGIFDDKMFEPTSAERKTTTDRNGVEREQASPAEQFMAKCKQLIMALNPEAGEKIEKGEARFKASSFDGIVKLLKKILDSKVGTQTQIKLLPNKNGYASLPSYVASINREGIVYISSKVIGKDLTLSSYEMSRIQAAATATPTNMTKSDNVLNDMKSDFGAADANEDDDLPF